MRFGSPTEMGLAWHDMAPAFRADFARYGAFNLHYLPKNLYYQFISYTLLTSDGPQNGGGLFWMTPSSGPCSAVAPWSTSRSGW